MQQMIRKVVPERLTLAQVKAHPWVSQELARRGKPVESEFKAIQINEEELRKAVIAGAPPCPRFLRPLTVSPGAARPETGC